ncbi:MAG: hypothetical protein ACUVR4_13285 [Anaerolineae bacterium]
MPKLARWYVKTAPLYLAVGTLFGAIILWNKGLTIPGAWLLLALHIALVTWGWLLLSQWAWPTGSCPAGARRAAACGWLPALISA